MSEPKQPLGKDEVSLSVDDLSVLLQLSLQVESELKPIYHLYQDQRNQLEYAFEQSLPQIERVSQSSSSAAKVQANSKSTSTAFLWNREGFTPIPSVVDANDLHTSSSSNLSAQQSEVPGQASSPVASKTQGLVSEVFEQAMTSPAGGYQVASTADSTHKEVTLEAHIQAEMIPSSITEEVEPFVPFVERLQQSQAIEEQQYLEREEPDSSIPQSLDEIYSIGEEELISNVQETAVKQALSINSKSLDPELHVALAPASLRQYRRTPWQKIILVCLFCLLFGGLLAYLYLYELASFME